jgi:peptidoglycan/LPS O-acetylase OafA/YrhL
MRNKRLDVLRSIAVFSVLFYHGGIGTRLDKGGWVGVDLFFVLSGFLISGLLFTEYKERGAINFKRFFLRRGLKLYPAFYAYVAAMLLYQIVSHRTAGTLGQYLSEILYVQNYGPFIWRHTWSLAVEEHFYILLPLFLLLLIRYSPNRGNPFDVIPFVFLFVAVACLSLRLVTVLNIPQASLRDWAVYRRAYATTHCRIDSLFFGVLLGYFHHFHSELAKKLLSPPRHKVGLVFLSIGLLSVSLCLPIQNRFMLTAGLTLLYLGFGCVLMLCLHVQDVLPKGLAKPFRQIGTGCAYIGVYSYSIYLWHIAFLGWGPGFVRHVFHTQLNPVAGFAFYLVVSIAVGVLMSKLIEYPILRMRDRILPAIPTSPTAEAESEIGGEKGPPAIRTAC